MGPPTVHPARTVLDLEVFVYALVEDDLSAKGGRM